jgi:hypothetical protein
MPVQNAFTLLLDNEGRDSPQSVRNAFCTCTPDHPKFHCTGIAGSNTTHNMDVLLCYLMKGKVLQCKNPPFYRIPMPV